jgi:YCII-related domain
MATGFEPSSPSDDVWQLVHCSAQHRQRADGRRHPGQFSEKHLRTMQRRIKHWRATRGPDKVLITDGPYLETNEHIGGLWVLEAADMDEALAWGRKAAVACRAPVELRPFH